MIVRYCPLRALTTLTLTAPVVKQGMVEGGAVLTTPFRCLSRKQHVPQSVRKPTRENYRSPCVDKNPNDPGHTTHGQGITAHHSWKDPGSGMAPIGARQTNMGWWSRVHLSCAGHADLYLSAQQWAPCCVRDPPCPKEIVLCQIVVPETSEGKQRQKHTRR